MGCYNGSQGVDSPRLSIGLYREVKSEARALSKLLRIAETGMDQDKEIGVHTKRLLMDPAV